MGSLELTPGEAIHVMIPGGESTKVVQQNLKDVLSAVSESVNGFLSLLSLSLSLSLSLCIGGSLSL